MDRISSLLPAGPLDGQVHRGARRHTTRYPLTADVRFAEPRVDGTVLNASAGGMRVAVDGPLDEGVELLLEVRFARGNVSRERVEVVWSREERDGWLVGLRFV